MPHAGQEIEGRGGLRLRIVRLDTEALELEATYAGGGDLPPEHLHPRQDERFEVLEGAMRTLVGGVERTYRAGESFDVPAGTPHQMAAERPTRVRWEVRPALRTAEFFERLYGSGPESLREAASPAEFLARYAEEIRITSG